MWGQRVSITLAFFKAASGMPVAESQHTLMLCSKMGLHGWGTAIASGIASHRHSRWFFVLHPSISAYPSARSDRKRGLAKLPFDDGLLRSCGTRPGRQLQYSRALAIAQARD